MDWWIGGLILPIYPLIQLSINPASVCPDKLSILHCVMFFAGLGTATPPNAFTPAQCWEALQSSAQFAELNPRSQAILRKVLGPSSGIAQRYLSFDQLAEAFALTPDVLHARFATNAPRLGSLAGARALRDAGLAASEADAVIVSTCTGYLCPGLTSYLIPRLGLRPNILAFDLVGQGCAAALPNLRMAQSLLASGQCRHVLSICVEVCSAAFYLDNDPGVLVSACLFADGAGAAVLSRTPAAHRSGRQFQWRDAASLTSPEDRDYLRFEQKNGFLRNILTKQVPALAAKFAESVLAEVLARNRLDRESIAAWIMHAGGREVLLALQERLGIAPEKLKWSAATLKQFGNVSSPFVFFVLEAALRDAPPPGLWWMSSFGAGFSCHGALIEVR